MAPRVEDPYLRVKLEIERAGSGIRPLAGKQADITRDELERYFPGFDAHSKQERRGSCRKRVVELEELHPVSESAEIPPRPCEHHLDQGSD